MSFLSQATAPTVIRMGPTGTITTVVVLEAAALEPVGIAAEEEDLAVTMDLVEIVVAELVEEEVGLEALLGGLLEAASAVTVREERPMGRVTIALV
jgi:hypothetical protein